MRLFVAVEMPPEVKDYLFELQKRVKCKEAKVVFVAKKNLHLTLSFLGEIKDDEIGNVVCALKNIGVEKFFASLDGAGVFGGRVVWAGLSPEDKVLELANRVDECIIKWSSSRQEFRSHITLGRIKCLKEKKKFLERVGGLEVEKKKFLVDCFGLYKSVLTKDGPKYSLVEKFGLD